MAAWLEVLTSQLEVARQRAVEKYREERRGRGQAEVDHVRCHNPPSEFRGVVRQPGDSQECWSVLSQSEAGFDLDQ